jgi:hypothetical protein
VTVPEKSHARRGDGPMTACGIDTRRSIGLAIAAVGEDPDCGNCVRLTGTPAAWPGDRCPECGYKTAKCQEYGRCTP